MLLNVIYTSCKISVSFTTAVPNTVKIPGSIVQPGLLLLKRNILRI